MMNVVQSGGQYQIYGESLKTYNELPVRSYEVAFHKMMGFFLTARPDLEVKEDKIYGSHKRRVDKTLTSFKNSNRNFGVILSGQKGIGKSLFARLLAQEAIANGFPVITVSNYMPGIANFIGTIEQEIVVIFDEFEKTFGKQDGQPDPQEEMLSLFDGLDGGKKLFIITCNEVRRLNDYMLNRPGRFHYHFNISNPGSAEIKEYMEDKLQKQYWDYIPRIINFSQMVDITYDSLRAISFELNQGYPLEECFEDLNISGANRSQFNVKVIFEDGNIYGATGVNITLWDTMKNNCWLHNTNNSNPLRPSPAVCLNYIPADIVFIDGVLTIPLNKIHIDRDTSYDYDISDSELERREQEHNARVVKSIIFEKSNSTIRYERYLV